MMVEVSGGRPRPESGGAKQLPRVNDDVNAGHLARDAMSWYYGGHGGGDMRSTVLLCLVGAVSACNGGWELHQDVSKMDGEHSVRLTHEAAEKLHFGQNTYTPWMTLRLHPTFALEV